MPSWHRRNETIKDRKEGRILWIFTTYGFFSFTQSTFQPGFIQIRARDDRDLEELREKHGLRGKIIETRNSDYVWRILVRPATAARILSEETLSIDYANFKNATNERQHSRPLMQVWSAMMTVQTRRLSSRSRRGVDRDPGRSKSYLRQTELFADGTLEEDNTFEPAYLPAPPALLPDDFSQEDEEAAWIAAQEREAAWIAEQETDETRARAFAPFRESELNEIQKGDLLALDRAIEAEDRNQEIREASFG